MQHAVWKNVFICSLALVTVALGEKALSAAQNLSGVYNYLSVNDLFSFQPPDPFFLALVCPKTVTVNSSDTQTASNLTLLMGAEVDSRCSFSSNGSSSSTEVQFQLLASGTSAENNLAGGKIALSELQNFFPLVGANITNAQIVCPLLNSTISNAQIRGQDMGFFHSLLNHYRKSGAELGTQFSEIESSSLAPIAHSFTLNIALDAREGLGCSYLKEGDETALRMEVLRLMEGEATTTPAVEETPSETPSATEESGESGESACFPASAMVKVKNGSLVKMSELKVGEEILDGDGSYSKVLMFTHSDAKVSWQFVQLSTANGSLLASRSHYVYANGALKTAASVQVGDLLSVHGADGDDKPSTEAVVRKRLVRERGLYNAQTASGSLVVFCDARARGFLSSAYTARVPPPVAHSLLTPLRWLLSSSSE